MKIKMSSGLPHHLHLLLYLVSISATYLAFAYEDPRQKLCQDVATIPNPTFSTNLNNVLTTLRHTTAATGFSTATSTNVTALALCRATIPSSECQLCVDAATIGILTSCPNQTQAQVWYTLCTIRYSDNFVNKSDDTIAFMLYDVRDAPDNNRTYDPKVKTLMQNLSRTAGASEKRYAVGRTTVSENESFIYGYVDCTRDVSGPDCTTCLMAAISSIPSCCLGKWAGWIATPTCNIQFNMDPVHDDWFDPPPPLIDTSAEEVVVGPPSTEVKGGSDGNNGGGGVKVGVLISVVVIGVLVVGVLWIMILKWRKARLEREDQKKVVHDDDDMGTRSFVYDFDVLVVATDNFSLQNRIGGGGFGSVYRVRGC